MGNEVVTRRERRTEGEREGERVDREIERQKDREKCSTDLHGVASEEGFARLARDGAKVTRQSAVPTHQAHLAPAPLHAPLLQPLHRPRPGPRLVTARGRHGRCTAIPAAAAATATTLKHARENRVRNSSRRNCSLVVSRQQGMM
jgi:hypothetical protein